MDHDAAAHSELPQLDVLCLQFQLFSCLELFKGE